MVFACLRVLFLLGISLFIILAGREMVSASANDEDYEFGLLFDASGVETTYYACTACHSEMIVAQQGLTRTGWEEMLEWMVDEHGMDVTEEPDLTEVLDYLSTHYNVDRPNFIRP